MSSYHTLAAVFGGGMSILMILGFILLYTFMSSETWATNTIKFIVLAIWLLLNGGVVVYATESIS